MDKKIVYIAHPISGDVMSNIKDLCRILRIINMNEHPNRDIPFDDFEFSNIVPQAPYYADIIALDDSVPLERLRGIENNIAMIKTLVYDELWLTGERISDGMQQEANLFILLGKPVINYIGKI